MVHESVKFLVDIIKLLTKMYLNIPQISMNQFLHHDPCSYIEGLWGVPHFESMDFPYYITLRLFLCRPIRTSYFFIFHHGSYAMPANLLIFGCAIPRILYYLCFDKSFPCYFYFLSV